MLLLAQETLSSGAAIMFVGQVRLGFWVSFTITRKVQPFVLPELSVATAVTILVPFGKVDPFVGVNVTLVIVQLSVAFVVNTTTAEHKFESVETMTLVQVSVGGSASLTVTVKLHVVFVPAAFVATTLTVV